MPNDISGNWTEIAAFAVTLVGLLVTLERRLSNKLDKTRYDKDLNDQRKESELARKELEKARETERVRIDTLFSQCFDRMERNQAESSKFREEIRDGINQIKVELARASIRGEK